MENTTTTAEAHTQYPKRYMSIMELVPYGFTKCELQGYLKLKGFPAYKPPGKTASWKIDTTKLDSWLTRHFGAKGV